MEQSEENLDSEEYRRKIKYFKYLTWIGVPSYLVLVRSLAITYAAYFSLFILLTGIVFLIGAYVIVFKNKSLIIVEKYDHINTYSYFLFNLIGIAYIINFLQWVDWQLFTVN